MTIFRKLAGVTLIGLSYVLRAVPLVILTLLILAVAGVMGVCIVDYVRGIL